MNKEQPPEKQRSSSHVSATERGIALAMAVIVLITLIVLAIQPRSMNAATFAVVRFLAATFAGIAGYLFAGNIGLEANIPFNKTQIRATGAFATFVLVLFFFGFALPGSSNSASDTGSQTNSGQIEWGTQTDIVNFGSTRNLNVLNSDFKWNQGGSPSSKYIISQSNAIQIVADGGTDHWQGNYSAPLIAYQVKGNFEAQVKVLFDPTSPVQAAGLGIRSSQSADTFVRMALASDPNYNGKSISVGENVGGLGKRLGFTPYRDNTTWMRMTRQNSNLTLSYSKDGKTWVDMVSDYPFELPAEAEVFLYAFSVYNNQNVVATFYDFALARPVQS
jgi:regulation of enolase protein 1 (concanavalin A-like superfamily)